MTGSGWEPNAPAGAEEPPADPLEPAPAAAQFGRRAPEAEEDETAPPRRQSWPEAGSVRQRFQLFCVLLPISLFNFVMVSIVAAEAVSHRLVWWPDAGVTAISLALGGGLSFGAVGRRPLLRVLVATLAAWLHGLVALWLLGKAADATILPRSDFGLIGGIVIGCTGLLVLWFAVGSVGYLASLEGWLQHELAQLARQRVWWRRRRTVTAAPATLPPLPGYLQNPPPQTWLGDRPLAVVVYLAALAVGIWALLQARWFETTSATRGVAWVLGGVGLVLTPFFFMPVRFLRLMTLAGALWSAVGLMITAAVQLALASQAAYSPTVWVLNNTGNWLVICGWLLLAAALGWTAWRIGRVLQGDIHASVQRCLPDRQTTQAATPEEDLGMLSGHWDEARAGNPPTPSAPASDEMEPPAPRVE